MMIKHHQLCHYVISDDQASSTMSLCHKMFLLHLYLFVFTIYLLQYDFIIIDYQQ